MKNRICEPSRDWLNSPRASVLAWGIPLAALVVGLFFPILVRMAIWSIALGWMGMACLLNGTQCGRTHCRYTGPYFLVMIVPVLAAGSDIVSVGLTGWLALAATILLGGALLWWATERAWGKFC